jgi:GntR family transcriptional regulator/MocR family aminotransferase
MKKYHGRYELAIPLALNAQDSTSLTQQLVDQLRLAIRESYLPPGTPVPSTRHLAAMLGVSRTVTSAAYDRLLSEGYLVGRQGSGTYVNPELVISSQAKISATSFSPRWLRPTTILPVDEGPVLSGTITFRLGMTTLPLESQAWWNSVWRKTAQLTPPTDYGSPEGEVVLRSAIADYLGRSRGMVCTLGDVLITAGSARSLDLIIRSALLPGDLVAIEEPGYPQARWQLLASGMRSLPVPLDEDGLQINALPEGKNAPMAVYLTPSHQYPLGFRLSLSRRLALLDWARANDVLLIEDDYDGEFRFDAPPLPTLASLDQQGHVAYLGAFSKVLTPALRCGYLVASRQLLQRVMQQLMLTEYQVSWLVQQALTLFLNEGYLERHIRRMRQHYAQGRAILHKAFAPIAHLVTLKGLEAGLHAYLELNVPLSVSQIIKQARRQGIVITDLETCYLQAPDRQGFLLGYGGLSLADIEQGALQLALILRSAAGER